MKSVGVQCRHIRLAYGANLVLRDISLDIAPGEFFALLGPSGSGKSTLLRLVAGFGPPHQGELRVDGRDVSGLPPWQRNVGMVFQSYALWPHLTVWDNVAFGLVERRVEAGALRTRVGAALELVGLSALAQRRPNQLSGGQQQRVALARTLVIEPQVLLLDEPLSNLDKTLRVQMRQELLAMQRRLGLTTIFVTHDQEEAMSTADRMAVLDQGVLQQAGTPAELYDAPVNRFVAGFVGTMNLLPARVRSRSDVDLHLDVDGIGEWRLPLGAASPAGDRLELGFRPHAARLDAAPGAALRLSGTVSAREFLGEFTRYHLRVGPHALAVDEPHRAGHPPHAVGDTLELALDASQLRLLAA
ncbi:MAG: ABC transporter ATP-binding protein [Rubrivivax sp.]